MKKLLYFLFLFILSGTFANEGNIKLSNTKDKNHVVIADSLKAIVLDDQYQENIDCENIQIKNIFVPKDMNLKNTLKTYLHKKVTLSLLNEIKLVIIDHYRRENFPLVAVKLPAKQKISNGCVQFVVSLAKLGDVKIDNVKYFSEKYMLKQISLKEGEIINTNKVLKDLEWFNDNPFRNVNVIYSESCFLSKTDVTFHVEEITPYRVYAGYENTGNAVAGESRFFGGVNLGNLFNLDQQLNFQFTSAKDPQKWISVSGTYIIPFRWHHYLKVLGSYSRVEPGVEALQNLKGKSYYIGARYEIQLMPYKKLSHDFIFGYDFKTTNNFLTYTDNLIFNNNIDISQFLIKYLAILEDFLGSTSLEAYCYLSPGHMTKDNKKSSFSLERKGAKPTYAYFVLDIERLTRFPYKFLLVTNFLSQISTDKLLLSEQLSLGGALTVRGYMENELAGDKGILFKNELRLPAIVFGRNRLENEIQFLGFVDYGIASEIDKSILDKNTKSILSIGPGVRYRVGSNFTFKLDLGYQLDKVKNRVDGKNNTPRVHININGAF